MTEARLIPDTMTATDSTISDTANATSVSAPDLSDIVSRSALWAAYGDALGWISELTNESGLRRRTAGEPLREPIEWQRRIGGRGGVTVLLPRGCYSDDSQLRLATGRAIRADGFDVEAFAKVELPIWLSYALGGGKSTTAAAVNMIKPSAAWFANRFRGWTNSGGNGAAMRIQPHVWSARALDDPTTFLPDVIRNAICTHSHPSGLMGAVIHALTLAGAMATGHPPSSEDLLNSMETAAEIPELMVDDMNVGLWNSAFKHDAGEFEPAWERAVNECRDAIQAAAAAPSYAAILDCLELRDEERRGSGMLTAVAAAGLTWRETEPAEAMRIAANELGTDTDTIATMAGAILGATADHEPPIEPLDADLFRSEANRLAQIARGNQTDSHPYPDLLHWSAPKARADALIKTDDGGLYVHGMGQAKPTSDPIEASQAGFMWQWIRLDYGQTVLIKRRRELAVKVAAVSVPKPTPTQKHANAQRSNVAESDRSNGDDAGSRSKTLRLEDALEYLQKNKDSDAAVGRAFRLAVNRGTPAELAGWVAGATAILSEPHPPVDTSPPFR